MSTLDLPTSECVTTTSASTGRHEENAPDLDFIPVLRPRLPSADLIANYLRRIDETRIYSSFGPLVMEFQARLEQLFGTARRSIVTASSGTSALIGTILGSVGTATASRPYALLPSFTFAATGIAVERCGYKPYLIDVSSSDWTLHPTQLEGHPVLRHVGVVVVVGPFGRPVDQDPWVKFSDRTGIPIVIDAAASFACIARSPKRFLGPIPTVLSLHATKSFGIGEGGCVISTEGGRHERVAAALNFGFSGERNSTVPSLNGRLSEYHAAVGLAGLDCWPAKVACLEDVAQSYRRAFASAGLDGNFFGFPEVDGNCALYLCASDSEGANVEAALARARIDFRYWYGRGLHHHTHFSHCDGDELPATELLGRRLIGLPIAPDLGIAPVERIVAAVSAGVSRP